MTLAHRLAWLAGSHFLADVTCQGEYLAKHKRESFTLLVMHCAIYTFVVGALNLFPVEAWAYLFAAHLFVDGLRGLVPERLLLKIIWLDQLLHLIVLFVAWRCYGKPL